MKNEARLGFYTAILTTAFTLVTFGIAILTPPLSGPFAAGAPIQYPYYMEIVSRFPRDYIWMYPAMLLTALYLVLIACIHHYAPREKEIYSQISLAFAIISSMVLFADYFVQISVIQPSLLKGETDGIALMSQYNPHGVFIALEDLGYLLMSVSFLCAAPVFSGSDRIKRAICWVLSTGFVLTIISLVIISVKYGIHREYIFEVAAISINWLVLIVSGVLLSIVFRRGMRTGELRATYNSKR